MWSYNKNYYIYKDVSFYERKLVEINKVEISF